MKRSIRFPVLVLVLLLLSAAALGGCMYAISQPSGTAKPYQGSGGVSLENMQPSAPASQDALYQKFAAMYEIDEESNTITVISPAYLDAYWHSAGEDESIIHTLTTEEVLYIIQDSIRIFYAYDYIQLPAFTTYEPSGGADNTPYIATEHICYPVRNQAENEAMITRIISYRISALTSPAAFITGYELCRYQGTDPMTYSSYFPETTWYFPWFSSQTDREMLIQWLLDPKTTSDVGEYFSLLLAPAFSTRICLYSDEKQTQVYPTQEMKVSRFFQLQSAAGDAGIRLTLNLLLGTFNLCESEVSSFMLSGRYELDGDSLVLYVGSSDAENPMQYIFHRTGEGFLYDIGLSIPSARLALPADTLLFADDYSLLDRILPECSPFQRTYYELTESQQAQIRKLLDGCIWICGTSSCNVCHAFSIAGDGEYTLCSCGTLAAHYQDRYTCLSPELLEQILSILQSSIAST